MTTMLESQEAVVDIGKIIKDLRRKHHLTGGELAQKAGMSQSKISKIETGFYSRLAPSDIEIILNILNAPKTITQQIMIALEQENYRYVARKVKPQWQELATILERERNTQLLRGFLFSMTPAILQTPEYRVALLKHYDTTPHDSLTMRRQDLLWDSNHTYNIILHESALYTVLATRQIQLGQLDRLERFIGAEYVKLGIIPLQAGMIPYENSSFVLYDERLVLAIVGRTELELNNPLDVAEHIHMFESLEKKAEYGEGARALIRKATDYFSFR